MIMKRPASAIVLVLLLCACKSSVGPVARPETPPEASPSETAPPVVNRVVVPNYRNAAFQVVVRPYTDYMIRIQYVPADEEPLPDDSLEMIESHVQEGGLLQNETDAEIIIETVPPDGIRLAINKASMLIEYRSKATDEVLLKEQAGMTVEDGKLMVDYVVDASEHFLGYGQKPLGYMDKLDLRGSVARRNYGEDGVTGRGAQGNLIVPFYMSSKGYGLFMNSAFPNEASFGKDGKYGISMDTKGYKGQMDLVFVMGPGFANMLDRYTHLTGRPRLPPKSIFGLQLSDNDPAINGKIDEAWWKSMVKKHRDAGFPLDHLVFDNDWRAGGGGWSGSRFEFDASKYPDPAEFGAWCRENGLTLTLDLNLNNANDSWGWQPAYNMPVASSCGDKNKDSYPDYTKPEVRDWVWSLFWNKALNPALRYPGDGLWIDEPDGVWGDCVPDTTLMGNGRPWLEMKNYYYFLAAKAVVQEGWDNTNHNQPQGVSNPTRRPYVWVRGMTAGGQRYATHWTGDIHFSEASMQGQIIAMQASGLSGFPYFNHDAGGFHDDPPGPNDSYYVQWAMAFGSFTPIWRPHGYGQPRWPLNRSAASQQSAMKYGKLRYQTMPYIYSLAHVAHATGMPMARSMSMMYPEEAESWTHELQYMWGDSMLVSPGLNLAGKDAKQSIWFPPGSSWYSYWNDSVIAGGQVVDYLVKFGEIPLFVKAGAVVPGSSYAQSTQWQSDALLTLDAYAGASGSFVLYEDDGTSEEYRQGSLRKTSIAYDETNGQVLTIHSADGTFTNASASRQYIIRLHGAKNIGTVTARGHTLSKVNSPASGEAGPQGYVVDASGALVTVYLDKIPVGEEVVVAFAQGS